MFASWKIHPQAEGNPCVDFFRIVIACKQLLYFVWKF